MFTCVEWRITLCDPIWLMMLQSLFVKFIHNNILIVSTFLLKLRNNDGACGVTLKQICSTLVGLKLGLGIRIRISIRVKFKTSVVQN